jgi:hypothetical protein
MGTLVVFSLIVGVIVLFVSVYRSTKKDIEKLESSIASLLADERFKNAKIFRILKTPMVISEEGYIGVIDESYSKAAIIHIKDVNGFELTMDSQKVSDVDSTVTDHWLFRDIKTVTTTTTQREEIHNMTLLLKINDFNNPTLVIHLIKFKTEKGTGYYKLLQDKINEILSILEIIEKKYKEK